MKRNINSKRKILSIVGARPQFVKLSPLHDELNKYFNHKIIHTGQHYEYLMSRIFFKELKLPKPDYNLSVGSGGHAHQTGSMLMKLEPVLLKEKPDVVLIYGDTNSTLAGIISAAKLNIKTAHIESGLRSYDFSMPEEVNRIVADRLSDFRFCPTRESIVNLEHEGLIKNNYLSGDVMVDLLLRCKNISATRLSLLTKSELQPKKYLLTTIHRNFNTDNKDVLKKIFEILGGINKRIVIPTHPRLRDRIKKFGLDRIISRSKNITILPPLGYIDFVTILNNAEKVITDSGGVQKEAFILEIPCITLRANTEWTETLVDHRNILTGIDKTSILKAVNKKVVFHKKYNFYGKGDAAKKITSVLMKILK